MHAKSIISTIAAMSVGFSGLTFAQQEKDIRADQALRDSQRAAEQQRDSRRARGEDGRRVESNRDRQWEHQRDDRRGDFNWREGGYHHHHHFNRGDRLPAEYWGHAYVVDDWREHRLSAPPRGYRWMQVDGDFLLVAITTGVIASILLNQ